MKPGRELDALVAEKVMGVVWCTMPNDPAIGYVVHGTTGQTHSVPQMIWSGTGWVYEGIPYYSADFTAAFTVVKQISKGGYPWPFREIMHENADVDEIPFQICLAALKAVGE